MILTILGWLAGLTMILAGLGWALMCFWAAAMADRKVDFGTEVLLPMSAGVIPVVFGVLLIIGVMQR